MSEEIVEIGSVSAREGEAVFEYGHRGAKFVFELHPEVAKPNTYSFFLLDRVAIRPGDCILDVGTGIGFLAIVLAGTYQVGRAVATDINTTATQLTRRNAGLNGLQHKLDIREGSLYEPVDGESFDLIVSQPRQTPTPDGEANYERQTEKWFYLNTSGGVDGLEFIGPLIRGAHAHLNDGGRLQLVVVDYLGTNRIMQMMSEHGLTPEITAELKTRLSPMTVVRKKHIEKYLQHSFPTDAGGKEYMHLVVVTATKKP